MMKLKLNLFQIIISIIILVLSYSTSSLYILKISILNLLQYESFDSIRISIRDILFLLLPVTTLLLFIFQKRPDGF
ncbi:hypothetical protein CHU_0377 [Cytophaga hutchinsonii ATCC 33406]|uniref:Uncharacterized protein n=1 Tax=Cytophaga hutchinsonii (strain ATCC 33406 / DSM 1761 / CIP 103989 / NBRC 15051 / NCIMB 9469 / D465) TaxID=269798 RepID=A0A6N4SN35_CYTH3|nr:hypothetical protein CHU_0377 [Cytophaga hutchinsonii ATCC 33406]SFX02450.1 hypothetical protein SAMN04487930_101228 [Cytophaga hutchinsonii ATCC 33406]